ncbi:MAG: glycosyltransferase, partial [Bacteroides sp.]|nr:glycosyltransferase [Bacteroides sp.]
DAEGGCFEHEDENGEWLDRFNWLSREKSDVFNGYALTFNPSKVITYNVENTSTKLTGAPENHEDGDWSQVMTLLPQTTPAWVHGKTLAEQAASGYGLLVINAKIVDAESSNVLYEGDIYTGIPANWSSGKRYTYTLNFGEGDNSWQGPDPEDPNIYGFPISLNVSVSDFVDVNGGQVLDPKHVNYNNAEVGDFMMNDGTLVKAQSAKYLSDAEKDNVIGMVAYVYNNRQLRYLLPLVNGLNRPVLLVCEPGVDEEVEVGEHVTAVELCFMDACPVYEDNVLETGFLELYRYYNTFFLMTEALRPEGVVVLEGCHYQEQVWGVIARKRGIPCIGIQQGWPSLMHTMFRNLPYSHYLTWGRNLSEYWKKYNPGTDFISIGYLYEVERKRGDDITFFLQAPVFISDAAYFDQLVELVVETAEKYPERMVGVREHPEYNLPASVVEKFGNYPNVRMMSDCTLAEAFAHTGVAVSHFSSALLEGVAHDCVPLVFDPARDSRYTPDVEQLGLGLIAYDKQSFFEKLEVILTDSSTFLEKILMRKEGWMQAVSGEAVKHAVDALTRIAPCRIPETTTVPKLHIGCGPFTLEGWLNTDIGSYRPEIRYLDAGRHYPFLDDSFEYIYSEHLFEHLELPQAATMLEECFRVLKPGGRMRLSMPDFHFLMELYRHPDEEPNRRYLAWSYRLFGEKKWGEAAEEDYPVHVINNFFHLWGHRFIHTPEHLTRMVERAGFEQFCRYPVGASDTPAFRNIERHRDSIPEWANELETFVVEMEKPIHPKEGKKEETAGIVPAVSVIVPVYNGEKYLECCLESLSGQSLENVEVVLVNDGSTDASGRMMKEYAAGHARCHYVEQENGGLSAARNAGLEHATGRYVAFLDCDDFLPQEALAKLYEKAVETDADIVAGNVAVFENGFTYDYHRRNADGGEVVSGVTFLSRVTDERRYVPMVYGYLYERAFIEKNRLRFEPGIIHEDELWTPIALAKAARVAAVGNVTCYYRQHGISIMKTACAEKRLASMACIIDKLMEFLRQGRLPEKGIQAIRARIGLLERMMDGLRMNKQ